MLIAAQRRNSAWERRMLAMADRLFADFDDLPVRTVFEAIASARATLRDRAVDPSTSTPEEIERLVREQLAARVAVGV